MSSSYASAAVKARSRERSSASIPAARIRASLSGGSARVTTITRAFPGRLARAWSTEDRQSASVTACRSSSTRISCPSNVAMPFISPSTASSTEPPAGLSRCSAPRPSPGRTLSTAVARYRHSRAGSLSRASRVTHASPASTVAHQERTAVVLPYPAGAATSVSDAYRPALSSRRTRRRSIVPRRTPGSAILASARGAGASASSWARPPVAVRRERSSIIVPRNPVMTRICNGHCGEGIFPEPDQAAAPQRRSVSGVQTGSNVSHSTAPLSLPSYVSHAS